MLRNNRLRYFTFFYLRKHLFYREKKESFKHAKTNLILQFTNTFNISFLLFNFLSPDFTSAFPVTGTVTFATAIVMIDIIEECGLPMKTTLPLALNQFDPQLLHGPLIISK